MADQKRWWKMHSSILTDDKILNLSPADRWAWVALATHVREHGEKGSINLDPSNPFLALIFGCAPQQVLQVLQRMPNVVVSQHQTTGQVSLKYRNWDKYAEDAREDGRSGFLKVRGAWKSRVEHIFSGLLTDIGIEFKEQQRFPHAKTFYTVDFYIPSRQIAFEIRGPEHATAKYRALDQRKSVSLIENFGVIVHAIDNTSILQNIDFVRSYVIGCIDGKSAASNPSQRRREEKREEEKQRRITPPTPSKGEVENAIPKSQAVGTQRKLEVKPEELFGNQVAGTPQKLKAKPEELFQIYCTLRGKLLECRKFTETLRKHCRARLSSDSDFIPVFTKALERANSAAFLCGHGDRRWIADFEWFVKNDTNVYKTLEGKYDRIAQWPGEPIKPTSGQRTADNLQQRRGNIPDIG